MDNHIKVTYPDSEKVYLNGTLYPDLRVGMRRVNLTPTVSIDARADAWSAPMRRFMCTTPVVRTATGTLTST